MKYRREKALTSRDLVRDQNGRHEIWRASFQKRFPTNNFIHILTN